MDFSAFQRSLNSRRPALLQSERPKSKVWRPACLASTMEFQSSKCMPPRALSHEYEEHPYLKTNASLCRIVKIAASGRPSLNATEMFRASPKQSIKIAEPLDGLRRHFMAAPR